MPEKCNSKSALQIRDKIDKNWKSKKKITTAAKGKIFDKYAYIWDIKLYYQYLFIGLFSLKQF